MMVEVLRGMLDAFVELFWPTRCVGCDALGSLLCPECEAALPLIDPVTACPHCGAPFGSLVCTQCTPSRAEGDFPFTGARAAGRFEGAVERMLTLYKDEGETRLAGPIARLLALAAGEDWRSWADVLVFIPDSPEAYRRRGFDHMERVAALVGRMTHIEVCDALVCGKSADQRALGRGGRARNVQGAFVLVDDARPRIRGRHVLLVDDVLTTGVTLSEATRVLLEGGAEEVRAVVCARVW
ncbi:MAG: ComF family protein [Actinomycetota bacterium]|nr:ComF family protein [Actinomycetota bacterium]